MPDEEHSGSEVTAQALAALDDSPEITALRLATERSYHWRLGDNDKQLVIEGELVLTRYRRRGFTEWLKIGQAIEILQREVMRQSGATTNMGRRYNEAWQELAPPQLSSLTAADRSLALWLWVNREDVQVWWDTKAPHQRDKWSHPATIKIQYDRDNPPTVTGPSEPEEGPRPRTPFPSASHGEVLARGIDRLDTVTDRVSDELGGTVSHITRMVREYDLSSSDTASDAARAFWATYFDAYGKQGIEWFVEALQTILRTRTDDYEPTPPNPPHFTRGN